MKSLWLWNQQAYVISRKHVIAKWYCSLLTLIPSNEHKRQGMSKDIFVVSSWHKLKNHICFRNSEYDILLQAWTLKGLFLFHQMTWNSHSNQRRNWYNLLNEQSGLRPHYCKKHQLSLKNLTSWQLTESI